MADDDITRMEVREKLIKSFIDITGASREEAQSSLEDHLWDLEDAISFFTTKQYVINPSNDAVSAALPAIPHSSDKLSDIVRIRSRSPPRERHSFPSTSTVQPKVNTQRSGDTTESSSSEPDGPHEYAGGELSWRNVHDDGDANIDEDGYREVEDDEADSQDGEDDEATLGQDNDSMVQEHEDAEATDSGVQEPHEAQDGEVLITLPVTLWRNGYSINESFTMSNDPENDPIIQAFQAFLNAESSSQIVTRYEITNRQDEDCHAYSRRFIPFLGVSRTLNSVSTEPRTSLVVDPAMPTTYIQLRLADDTTIVTRFNMHHTVRDIRVFIDESRPDASRDYQLFSGFPPQQLTELDQTIEQADISNSALFQRY